MKRYWLKLTSQVFWHDRVVVIGILTMLIFNIVLWLMVARVERVEAIVPWHYTVYFGIDRVGPWWKLIIYPLFGSLVALFNFLLMVGIYHQRRLFSYLIMIVANLVQVILFLQILGLMLFII